VAHEASSFPSAAPPEVAAILGAASEAAREDAWPSFVREFSGTILRVSRSLGGDHDVVMDRYAFVLDKLRENDCRRLRAYVRPMAGEFGLWLIVVVRRLCLDHYRERYGRQRDAAAGADSAVRHTNRRRLADLVGDRIDPAELAAPAHAAPDVALLRSERRRALASAVEQLSDRDRLLLHLRFAEELPIREIGSIMRFPTVFHVYRRLDAVFRTLRRGLHLRGVEDAES
jgi:RNA polymerase sigma factor (sigma-70 family)